jgi:protease I
MPRFTDRRVAVLATDGFEEQELTEPVKALKGEGARVDVVAPGDGPIQAFRHHDKSITVTVDRRLGDASADEYDALVLPGGALNADALRVVPAAQAFVRAFEKAGKPIAVICHGPWLLVSAGLVRGRKLTSYHTIRDDITNAGGEWQDRAAVEDRNWVTSRKPDDLPDFIRSFFTLLERSPAHAHS